MAYDEGLAYRIRELVDGQPGLVEKKMFGGLSFMVQGNMACGVIKEDLVVRVGPESDEAALALPHARPFDFTGKPMAGWIMVAPEGYESDDDLKDWVQRGVDFARSLPPK